MDIDIDIKRCMDCRHLVGNTCTTCMINHAAWLHHSTGSRLLSLVVDPNISKNDVDRPVRLCPSLFEVHKLLIVIPPAAVASAKYLLSYMVGGTPVAKQNSLVGDGLLKVQMEHHFAKVLPAAHLPALGGGELGIDLRKIEFVILTSTAWTGRMRFWRGIFDGL